MWSQPTRRIGSIMSGYGSKFGAASQRFSSDQNPIRVYTDASAGHGFGCIWGKAWLTGRWTSKCLREHGTSMEFLEAYPILAAIKAYGRFWVGRQASFHCDNDILVERFDGKCSRQNPHLQPLLEAITASARSHNIDLKVVHADTSCDMHRAADGLSKGSRDKFLKYHPEANDTATPLPPDLDLVERSTF